MNKAEFLQALSAFLSPEEREQSLQYYSEMIDDRIEDGISEEDAVAALGAPQDIAAQLAASRSPERTAAAPFAPAAPCAERTAGRVTAGQVAAIITLPFWGCLLVTALILLWVIPFVLFVVSLSLALCTPLYLLSGIAGLFGGKPLLALTAVGSALLCAGGAILCFLLLRSAARGTSRLSRILLGGSARLLSGHKKE